MPQRRLWYVLYRLNQPVAIQHGVNGEEAIANLARTPVGLSFFAATMAASTCSGS